MSLRFVVFALFLCVCYGQETACPEAFGTRQCRNLVRERNAAVVFHEACDEVPFAPGCAVDTSCHATDFSSDFCRHFNSLLAVCNEFGDLDPCVELVDTCGPVEDLYECDDVIDFQLPSSSEVYEAVREICDEEDMELCDECLETSANPDRANQREEFMDACMDPMVSWSALCMEMNAMEMNVTACDGWSSWCELEETIELPGICINGTITDDHDHDEHDHDEHDHDAADDQSGDRKLRAIW